ncbi:MAG: CsbD family protein [Gemmatimonas sp.]
MTDFNDRAAKNRVEGAADEAKGKLRNAAGDLTDNSEQQVKGKGEELKGKAKQALADVQDAIGDAADGKP